MKSWGIQRWYNYINVKKVIFFTLAIRTEKVSANHTGSAFTQHYYEYMTGVIRPYVKENRGFSN